MIQRIQDLIEANGDTEVVIQTIGRENVFELAAAESQPVRRIGSRWETFQTYNTETVIKIW